MRKGLSGPRQQLAKALRVLSSFIPPCSIAEPTEGYHSGQCDSGMVYLLSCIQHVQCLAEYSRGNGGVKSQETSSALPSLMSLPCEAQTPAHLHRMCASVGIGADRCVCPKLLLREAVWEANDVSTRRFWYYCRDGRSMERHDFIDKMNGIYRQEP